MLKKFENKTILDAGCGAGPWSILAAQHGATVFAVDLQQKMISQAEKAAHKANVSESIYFSVASVEQLPYENEIFDGAISINVGCTLPSNVFANHFKEMFRTLKPSATAIITAPENFSTLFTDGTDPDVIIAKINHALDAIGTSHDFHIITKELGNCTEILRATFAFRNDKLTLIENESDLVDGELIYRKIPGLAVSNIFHSEKAYVKNATAAGFEVIKIDRPCFKNENEWHACSIKLGKEYIGNHPFIIIHLQKPTYKTN